MLVLGTPQGNRKINLDDDKRTDEAALSDGSPPIIKYVVKEVKTPRNKDSSGTEILQAKKSKAKIKKQLTDSEVNLGKLTQTNIQMRGTQIITTKNQIKIIAKDQIAKASSLRKTLRLIIFISAFAVTILLMTLSYFLFSRKGSFNISSQLPLVLTLDQCNLVMYDKGSQDGDISISYRIPGIYSKAKWTTNTTDEFLFSNHILNEQCFIDMYIDTTKILPQLTINCLSACNITQNSTLLTIQNDLSINGITIYANFKDLKADSFNFNATKGYLQLNHIVLTGSSDNSISLNGDIIIQSSQSFSVAAQTDTQAFCFAAPVVTPLSVTDCALSGDSKFHYN